MFFFFCFCFFLPFFCHFFFVPTANEEDDVESVYTEVVQLAPNFKFSYGIDELVNDIFIQLEVKTQGWVGFGLSNSGMVGADIILASVSEDGIVQITDSYSRNIGPPSSDVVSTPKKKIISTFMYIYHPFVCVCVCVCVYVYVFIIGFWRI